MRRLLRRLLLLLVRLFGAAGARGRVPPPLRDAPHILLIRPDFLGDLVLTTPVIHALRTAAPRAQLSMMVGPWSKEIVARHPDLDLILTCPFPGVRGPHKKKLKPLLLLQVAKQLRHERYDLAINLCLKSWWTSALIYLAGIPRRTGYASKHSAPFLTQALPVPSGEHLSVSSLCLISAGLQSLGYPPLVEPYTPERYPLDFTLTAGEQQWACQFLNAGGIMPATPIVIIHPGAGAAVKCWRSEGWATCATILTRASLNPLPLHFLLTGTPKERPLLEEIAGLTTARTTLVTQASVGQLAALMRRAQLVLGVDSGPLHLAVAQGVPTVRIYGPIDPRIFGPWGSPGEHPVIISPHRCLSCVTIPCGNLDFPPRTLAFHPCVRLVSEQHVLGAIAQHFPALFDRELLSSWAAGSRCTIGSP